MGKFFDALNKSQKQRNRTAPKAEPGKVVRLSSEELQAVRLDSIEPKKPVSSQRRFSSKLDPRLITLLEPRSIAAEAFKLLRAKIFCSNLFCRGRTIMVTSGQPLDGKSAVAANLAISIAQGMDEYVLLIDGDLRKPTLHTLFGLSSGAGLREYIEDGTSVAPFLQKLPVKKLSLLPAGEPPPNPADLISSEKMRSLIQELRARYQDRYIIIDTSPASFVAETNTFATMVDSALLVVRSGKSEKELIQQAVENIGREKILGVVFNCSDMNEKKYALYQYYYSGIK
jgi:protein-tyrosine kinase